MRIIAQVIAGRPVILHVIVALSVVTEHHARRKALKPVGQTFLPVGEIQAVTLPGPRMTAPLAVLALETTPAG
ncbi:hypothetical protein A2160_03275 [Candidatus Beckwithbacteria bacterium RBG_13_42_9]|uniref:Uncharacterized protein n=1 Tax=Candidatus Beckwithbacteria bacterium RBG_13_42_9 TaxID=1797457 RepID=A0A1F5E9D2_9BACT|nr:MAG: hypothetical protein A2160_03275 [Candidatus Beckwithbacteria bacterium RBG_13_42_9]